MFKRKNPMPMSGALFLSNPRKGGGKKTASSKSSSTKTRKAKRPSVAARIIARLNRSASTMKKKTNRRRKNGLALRMNGLALRMNRKRKHNRKHKRKNGLALRMNGLALRMNRRRKTTRRRRNTRSMVIRPRIPAAIVLKNRRRRVRRNTGMVASAKSGAMGLVAPLAFGAAAGALHLYALRFLGGYLPGFLKPVGYTIGGVAVKALLSLKFIPGSASFKKQLGDAAVVIGAAFDVTRALKGQSSEFGDGGFYTLGGHTRPFDSVERVISAQYSDAKAADALHTTEDLTASEVDAALRGGSAWVNRFPFISRQQNATGGCSRHAAQAGHRWAWLCNMIGFENFRKLAASSPDTRKAYIKQVRVKALEALRALKIAEGASAPAVVIEGKNNDYGYGYGSTLFAGGPF